MSATPAAPPQSRAATGRRLELGLVCGVLGAAAALCLLTGIAWVDVGLFASYQLAFVLVPGVVTYGALASRPGGLLRHVCVGAAVGLALELTAFIGTAAIGARDAFLAYPALVLLVAAPPAWRRRRGTPVGEERFSYGQLRALAAIAICVLALFAAGSVSQAPLPDRKPSVSYYPDLVWGMSFAAEAKHHWPLTTPQVSGEPLRYHTFVFVHMAAISQATGIELPAVALRLVPLPLLLLLLLQLAYAGRHLSGRPWAGPLAAALLLLVGDLDLAAPRAEPFLGVFFSGLFLSPTQLLGLVAFVPAVVVIRDMLAQSRESAGRAPPAGDLTVLALLLFVGAGAKAAVLPVLLGGLVLLAAWSRLRSLRVSVLPLVLTALALLASYLLLYSGSRGASEVGPLESALRSFPGARFRALTEEGVLGAILGYPIATVVTLLALMPALVGLVWVARQPGRLTLTQAWLLALLATSVAAFLLLDLPGVSQLYFLWYGFVAGAFVSARGLIAAWEAWTRQGRPRTGGIATTVAATVALLLGLDIDVGGLPLATLYVALLVLLGAVFAAGAVGVLDVTGRHAAVVLLAAAALLAAGVLDGPLDRLPPLAKRAVDPDETVYQRADPVGHRGVTVDLARGLEWIRDNTRPSAVLAVNNHLVSTNGDSRYFYYSALAERRVYLESWDYTDRALAIGLDRVRRGLNPYPRRLELNDAAFDGHSASLEALRRAGVTHLVVDRVNARGTPRTAALGRPAYANRAIVVYALA